MDDSNDRGWARPEDPQPTSAERAHAPAPAPELPVTFESVDTPPAPTGPPVFTTPPAFSSPPAFTSPPLGADRPIPGLVVPEPASAAPQPRAAKASMRTVLTSGIIGAVVAALVCTGIFVATDSSESDPISTGPAVAGHASTQIGQPVDVQAILQKDVKAVVAIVVNGGPNATNGAAGTGFVISADGVIVTNNHVVEGATTIQATFSDGKKLAAKLVGYDPVVDLAVVKVDGVNLPSICLGDSSKAEVGDDVIAIGNALALDGGLSVTQGIVSGLHRQVPTNTGTTLDDMLQTDAAINPGNSGGPLVDTQGCVIAINTAVAANEAQNIGFAIPITGALPVIDQLRQGKRPSFLGVQVTDANSLTARRAGVTADTGALVVQVTAGSPAAQAGLRNLDVVTAIGSDPVTRGSDVATTLRKYNPGTTVTVTIVRNGTPQTLSVALVERPLTTR